MRITEVIDKGVIRKLTKVNDKTAALHLALRISVEVFLIYLLFRFQNNILLLGVTTLMLGFVHSFWGYAGYAHELFHRRVFSSNRLNKSLFRFSSAITYSNRAFFEASHMHHHSSTFSDDDDEGHSLQRWDVVSVTRYALFDYAFMWRKVTYTLKNALGIIPAAFSAEKKNIRQAACEVVFVNALIYITIFLISQSWIVLISYFIAQFSCQLPNRMLAQAQHLGLENQKDDGPLGHSRTIKLPTWLALLYSNMNYHCEHHLIPSVPYYNLPELNKCLKQAGITFEEVGISYLFKTFWQMVLR